MKSAYYEIKTRIVAMATAYHEGDEATKEQMRKTIDYFPLSRSEGDLSGRRSMFVRVRGEIFLVEDTQGGEIGVFSLMLPIM